MMRVADRLRGITAAVALVGLGAVASPASAAVITPDQWYGFTWSGALPAGTTGQLTFAAFTPIANPGASPWTFNIAEPTNLFVVDGFNSGDQFEAFNFGASLGVTSLVPLGEVECVGGNDPITCLADPRFSSGVFLLVPGNYSLTIQTVSGLETGGSWFGFQPASVPEPGSLGLLALGAAAAIARRRIRR